MKKLIFLLVAICFLPLTTNAQLWKARSWEASVGVGPTLLFGDIGGYSRGENLIGFRDMGAQQTRINAALNFKYRILRDVNARLSLGLGTLHASDMKGSNVNRGFESRSFIIEPSVLGEYYFIKNKVENNYLFVTKDQRTIQTLFQSFDFYVFTGLGANVFSITANDALAATNAFQKKGSSLLIPVGLGTNFIFDANFNFGAEVCGRYVFSDHLDGYSSQYSASNDVYYTINLTATYKFRTGPKGGPSFKRF